MRVIFQTDCRIEDIVEALEAGKTIVYPTETCYGLGCDATNEQAVEKVYRIKGRERGKPLIVLLDSVKTAKTFLVWNDMLEQLAQAYWPGGLTIVASSQEGCGLASGVIGEDGTIAARVIAHPFAHALLKAFGRPVVSTSANLSGGKNLYDPKEIIAAFEGRAEQPGIFIDAGVLLVARPTTVVKVADGLVEMVRQGEVKI